MSQNMFSESGRKKPLDYLLPITAAMLRNTEKVETKLFMNGRELIAVLFAGKVEKVVISPRRVDYSMADCSDTIQVTKCIDDEQEVHEIPVGSYVKVYGKPSMLNSQPILKAFRLMPCQYDDVTEHWMSVLQLEQYIKKVGEDVIKLLGKASEPSQMSIDSKLDENSGLTQAQNQLLTLIHAQMHQTEDGVNVNWLSEQLQRDIQRDLTHLMDQGLVYDTINEEWVKSTLSDTDANMDEDLSEAQSELLMVIKAEQHQTVNGVSLNWLSDFLERDVHNDLAYLMNMGLVYDTISEEWLKPT